MRVAASFALSEVSAQLSHYLGGLDADGGRELEAIQERRAALATLIRRYGPTLDDVIDHLETGSSRLVELDGIDCGFERRAHLAYTTDADAADAVAAEAQVAAELGLPASHVSTSELPFPIAGAVRFEHQAQFHPRRYCLGLVEAIVRGGGRVYAHTRARDIDTGVVVTDVDPKSAAAGRRVKEGDVILKVAGKSVTNSADVGEAIKVAHADNKNSVLIGIRSGAGSHYVALLLANG